jgi:hypothetical protein
LLCRAKKEAAAEAAYLDSCRQLALLDMEILTVQRDNQRLAADANLQEDKIRGRDERREGLRQLEVNLQAQLRHGEDQNRASEAAL